MSEPITAELDLTSPVNLTGDAVDKVADLTRRAIAPTLLKERFLVQTLRSGTGETINVIDLEDHEVSRKRVHGSYSFDDVDSLLAYAAPFKTEHSTAWVSAQDKTVTIVLNDHQPGGHGKADHRAATILQRSPEWTKFARFADRGLVPQRQFAEFLEDNALYITEPTGAALLEIASNFESTVTSDYKSVERLQNGTRQFTFAETEKSPAGTVAIPANIALTLRPFIGLEYVVVLARLKYKATSDGLTLGIELVETDEITETALTTIRETVAESFDRTYAGRGTR